MEATGPGAAASTTTSDAAAPMSALARKQRPVAIAATEAPVSLASLVAVTTLEQAGGKDAIAATQRIMLGITPIFSVTIEGRVYTVPWSGLRGQNLLTSIRAMEEMERKVLTTSNGDGDEALRPAPKRAKLAPTQCTK